MELIWKLSILRYIYLLVLNFALLNKMCYEKFERTALLQAADAGYADIVEYLWSTKANKDAIDIVS